VTIEDGTKKPKEDKKDRQRQATGEDDEGKFERVMQNRGD
jgi:hypothetical protein